MAAVTVRRYLVCDVTDWGERDDGEIADSVFVVDARSPKAAAEWLTARVPALFQDYADEVIVTEAGAVLVVDLASLKAVRFDVSLPPQQFVVKEAK